MTRVPVNGFLTWSVLGAVLLSAIVCQGCPRKKKNGRREPKMHLENCGRGLACGSLGEICVSGNCECDSAKGWWRDGAECAKTCDLDEYKCKDEYKPDATKKNAQCPYSSGCTAELCCARVDECISLNITCGANAYCENIETPIGEASARHKCVCLEGFNGNATVVCEDIDECEDESTNVPKGSICVNTNGDYDFKCEEGYVAKNGTGNSTRTQCAATCQTSRNGYEYRCKKSTLRFAVASRNLECPSGLCTDDVCCSTCENGFELNSRNQCVDVDECERKFHTCAPSSTCENTAGDYICKCKVGYENRNETDFRGSSCAATCDTHENGAAFNCGTQRQISAKCDTGGCTASKCCASCPVGQTGNGTVCVDRNECEDNSHECSENATCTDVIYGNGWLKKGFTCQCNRGYLGDGIGCNSRDADCDLVGYKIIGRKVADDEAKTKDVTECAKQCLHHEKCAYWNFELRSKYCLLMHSVTKLEPNKKYATGPQKCAGPLSLIAGDCSKQKPCEVCMGHCQTDDDCVGELRCHNSDEMIRYACNGTRVRNSSYCGPRKQK